MSGPMADNNDSIGGTLVPLDIPATGFADTDPLLTYLLQYFQAVGNRYGYAAWQAVQPNSMPIKKIFAHDPKEEDFNENALPALYCWRSEQTDRVDIAADIENIYSTITFLWVPPTTTVDRRRLRRPFVKGLFNTFDVYFERGRDPAWYIDGDTYPEGDAARTALLGSVLPHYAKYARALLTKWTPTKISLAMGTAEPRTYEAYLATMQIEEWVTKNIDRFDALDALDQKIDVPANDDLPSYTIVEGIST